VQDTPSSPNMPMAHAQWGVSESGIGKHSCLQPPLFTWQGSDPNNVEHKIRSLHEVKTICSWRTPLVLLYTDTGIILTAATLHWHMGRRESPPGFQGCPRQWRHGQGGIHTTYCCDNCDGLGMSFVWMTDKSPSSRSKCYCSAYFYKYRNSEMYVL